jgi:tRNA pseudouridine55 synthase
MTSHDVVGFLRRRLSIKKIGHLGTLDPGAAGVLPLAIGSATRLIEFIPPPVKGYRVEVLLGEHTDSFDRFGTLIEKKPVPAVDLPGLKNILESFTGTITQKPPLASSVKVGGRHLYNYYREGKEVKVPLRTVHIEQIDIADFNPPLLLLDVICGGGTYIRSLCSDIGQVLGCGALMSFLVRFRSGPFLLENAIPVNEVPAIETGKWLEESLINAKSLFSHFPAITLSEDQKNLLLRGQAFEVSDFPGFKDKGDPVLLFSGQRELLAIGRALCRNDRIYLQPVKVLVNS